MLTQPPTKFELEPRLSLAKTRVDSDRKRKVCLYLYWKMHGRKVLSLQGFEPHEILWLWSWEFLAWPKSTIAKLINICIRNVFIFIIIWAFYSEPLHWVWYLLPDYQLTFHILWTWLLPLTCILNTSLLTCMLACFLYTCLQRRANWPLLTVNSNHPKSHTSHPLNFHWLYLVNFKFMIYLKLISFQLALD